MTLCLMTFGSSIFDRSCWTPWPMTRRSLTWPTFDSTDFSPYRPSTGDLWHYDHNYTIILDLTDLRLLNLSFLTCEFWAMFIILDRSTPFHHWYFAFDFLAFDFQVLTCDPMTFCLMILGTSIFDQWCWTPWPMTRRSLTWPTFDSTDLSPYRLWTRDLWHYDHNCTIIFDLTDHRLLILSFFTCEFWAMFITLDRSTPLHHWCFSFDFLAFDFQLLICDPMRFCLMTFDTSIFDRWCLTPWPMTTRSLTWPRFDSTDLSPYRPSTSDLWHYDHNYTIIFDLTELPLLNLSFLTCEFRAMFIILDRSTPFITEVSPLTSWPLISKFWPVTSWPFAWWPLAPASLTDHVGHHDLWQEDLLTWPTFDSTDFSPYRPSTGDLWHYGP